MLFLLGGSVYFFWPRKVISPLANVQFTEKSLEKYDFDNLAKLYERAAIKAARTLNQENNSLNQKIVGAGFMPAQIEILGKIKAVEDRRVTLKIKDLKFDTREIRFKSDEKYISGMINYFNDNKKHGIIIMIRGYAEKEGYYPGFGTWKVADELSKAGYATISLDFLGYGNSDSNSTDVLEARFHKVIEVLDLIQSVKLLPWVDKSRIGIWAHSNGGQIALSVLEISGEKYPTVLWAPMTQPFPQSLIDTADEGEARQKAIDFVNLFNKYYDSRRYAFENYYEWINAPILIQQGTADTQVKVEWQQNVVRGINEKIPPSSELRRGKVELQIFDGADHNMNPAVAGWTKAVNRDIYFFDLNLAFKSSQ